MPAEPTRPAADLVERVVDVADDHGHDGVEPGQQGALRRRLDGAEQHGRVAHGLLERGLVAACGCGSMEPSASSRACGLGWKPATYSASRRSRAGADVGHRQHGVGRELLQADPQAQVVAGQAPVLARSGRRCCSPPSARGERGRGIGQVVLAEGPAGQVPDHRAGGHAEHHRRQQLRAGCRTWPASRRLRRAGRRLGLAAAPACRASRRGARTAAGRRRATAGPTWPR